MTKHHQKPARGNHDRQMRQRLAQEAAQILLQRGNRDFHAAKQKAAEHLSVPDTRNLPNNAEIEQANLKKEYKDKFANPFKAAELGYVSCRDSAVVFKPVTASGY